jgi:EmrB/QacA subfamily drug resistance transporter
MMLNLQRLSCSHWMSDRLKNLSSHSYKSLSNTHSSLSLTEAQRLWVLAGVGLGIFMSTLDVGIINVALPTLVKSLNTSFPMAQWAVLSYSLISSSLVLGATRLGDIHGKKPLYLTGLALFTIGSLLCGLAPGISWLIIFRALQGFGAVFISGLGFAIITEVFPSSERGRAVGIIGSLVSLGVALGPSIGGLLLAFVGWRSIFLVNVPLGLIASFLVLHLVPPSIRSETPQRFDLLGAGLALVTLSSFALGMTQGQQQGFGSAVAIRLLVTAVIALLAFLLLEDRLSQPLLELKLFRNRQLSVSLWCNWLVFMVLAGSLLVSPFFLERVMRYPLVKLGLLLAIPSVVSGFISPISGAWSDRFGFRIIGLIGLIIMIISCLLISTLTARTTDWDYALRYGLFGVGLGIFRSPNDSSVMGSVPRERLGIASGLLSLSRTSGVTVGASILGAVFGTVSVAVAGGVDASAAPTEAIVAGFRSSFQVAALILSVAAIALALNFRQLKPAGKWG